MGGGTKTFEFEDGGEKVNAKVTKRSEVAKLLIFELSLDDELVYRLP
jgi:hypothetical protein